MSRCMGAPPGQRRMAVQERVEATGTGPSSAFSTPAALPPYNGSTAASGFGEGPRMTRHARLQFLLLATLAAGCGKAPGPAPVHAPGLHNVFRVTDRLYN